VKNRKGYATVYWGKMPINFRPRDFSRHEVEAAVGYAERSFRDVSDLVPDFSVLTLGTEQEGETKAALVLGDEREARGRRESFGAARQKRTGALKGSCEKSPCASGPGAGEERDASTSAMGDRPPVLSSS